MQGGFGGLSDPGGVVGQERRIVRPLLSEQADHLLDDLGQVLHQGGEQVGKGGHVGCGHLSFVSQ